MRVVRGVAAIVVLLLGLVATPWLLSNLSALLWPERPSWNEAVAALLRPDDGSIVLALLLLVAWGAWAIFALSVVVEVLGFVSGYRINLRLPGLAGPQRLVAGLLVSVVTLIAVPQPSMAQSPPGPPMSAPAVAGAEIAAERPVITPRPERAAVADEPVVRHTVESGDDLWSLAERFYGNGRDWRKIAAANPGVLTGGPDRLVPGWVLTIPEAPRRASVTAARTDPQRVRVQPGDTLSALAERTYGDADRWPEIYRANRDVLEDPDQVPVGLELRIPAVDEESGRDAEPPRRASPAPRDTADEGGTANEVVAQDGGHAQEGGHAQAGSGPRSDSPGPVPRGSAAPVPDSAEPTPVAEPSSEEADIVAGQLQVAAGLAAVGGLLAAGLVAGLIARRRLQLSNRPVGRRLLHSGPVAQAAEVVLGRAARPLGLRSLDLATRAIGAHAHATGAPPPELSYVRVGADKLELHLAEEQMAAPAGFVVDGPVWSVTPQTLEHVREQPGLSDALRPYPGLVTVGSDDRDRAILVDLESIRLLGIAGPDPATSRAALVAMASELSFSPWADELSLTVVTDHPVTLAAAELHTVSSPRDLDALLDRLETKARQQRAQAPEGPGLRRVDPDLADPWAPELVLVATRLQESQLSRLLALLQGDPTVTIAVVVTDPVVPCRATIRLSDSADGTATLDPAGVTFGPQLLGETAATAVEELITVTGSEDTEPAPWWSMQDPDPPDNVAYLSPRPGDWATSPRRAATADHPPTDIRPEEEATMITGIISGSPADPVLRLLGPVDLVGAAGTAPPRAARQCLEYCGWLLEHPGGTAQRMTASLAVAEGTRRSNVSRLRTWLGTAADGTAYLPDAYTGRITLHPSVSSDWHWLQICTAAGINRASDDALHTALDLVRGEPLADAAPGQWRWAEELRIDMISAVRDVGVELARRSLRAGDIDVARWAAARALVVSPGDELLLVERIRTEHRAGNRGEVERLTLQVAAQARHLGVDLREDTVVALQEVMEGRARARLA